MPNQSPDEFNRLVTETFGTIGQNPAVYVHNFNLSQQQQQFMNRQNQAQNQTPSQTQPQTQPQQQTINNNNTPASEPASTQPNQTAFPYFSSPSVNPTSTFVSPFATNPTYAASPPTSQNNSWASNNNTFLFEELRSKYNLPPHFF